MSLTREQFERVSHLLPKQRGNVVIDNFTLLQGLLYAVENGGKRRKLPWEYDKEVYKKRNIVERHFRHLKGFRRICTRYDKTDVMFLAYIRFAFIFLWIK